MITLTRTDIENTDFKNLVVKLDAYLRILDGEDHAFYAQHNRSGLIKYVVVAYENDKPVGCGGLKEYADEYMEIKRMYVPAEERGKGMATKILHELEMWAKESGFKKCILETGIRQPEAISLYKKNGYKLIENYGQYKNMENSVCFEKDI